VGNRLADEHAIERVFMVKGQLGEMQHGLFVEWQGLDTVLVPLLRDKLAWRLG
jgi:hypothetical protein